MLFGVPYEWNPCRPAVARKNYCLTTLSKITVVSPSSSIYRYAFARVGFTHEIIRVSRSLNSRGELMDINKLHPVLALFSIAALVPFLYGWAPQIRLPLVVWQISSRIFAGPHRALPNPLEVEPTPNLVELGFLLPGNSGFRPRSTASVGYQLDIGGNQ